MTNDYLNSSLLGKESKISDQRNDYTRSMKVIKLNQLNQNQSKGRHKVAAEESEA